jgi:hypothetical protein
LTITREYDEGSFVVQLWRRLPESADVAGIRFDTEKKFEGGMDWRVYATGSKEANEAAISLMLALYIGTLDAIRAAWHSPPQVITLSLWGLWVDGGVRVPDDLLGPLKVLAKSFAPGTSPQLLVHLLNEGE